MIYHKAKTVWILIGRRAVTLLLPTSSLDTNLLSHITYTFGEISEKREKKHLKY